jgi:hypothetical protein
MNPSLPVVAQLVARGCKVTYFVEESMKVVVEAAGASWLPFRYPGSSFTGILLNPNDFEGLSADVLETVGIPPGTPSQHYQFPSSLLLNAQLVLPDLIKDLQSLDPVPCAIVYEPFVACAPVAAHALKIPGISLLTMPGPGVLSYPTAMFEMAEAIGWMSKPRQWIQDTYGLDVLSSGTIMGIYSPQLNIVATVESLYSPPASEIEMQRFGHFTFARVGLLADSSVKRIVNAGDAGSGPVFGSTDYKNACFGVTLDLTALTAPLPLNKVREMKDEGRRIVFISMGTVATQSLWTKPLSFQATGNDETPEGARSIMEYTGKEFCLTVYRMCFEVLERDATMVAIISMGSNAQDALNSLPTPPGNLIIRESVPQLELLPLCDAFITHGGANSMHEALSMSVPLVVIPVIGDQMANADRVAECGAGFSFRHPMKTLSVATLSNALQQLLPLGSQNRFRIAAARIAEQIKQAGGVPAAVTAILGSARATVRA